MRKYLMVSTKRSDQVFARLHHFDGAFAWKRYSSSICAPFLFPELSERELDEIKILGMDQMKTYLANLRGVSPDDLVLRQCPKP
jgi:hypothetical protein